MLIIINSYVFGKIQHLLVTYKWWFRNDLYCVGWGVKLYSLTHLWKLQ